MDYHSVWRKNTKLNGHLILSRLIELAIPYAEHISNRLNQFEARYSIIVAENQKLKTTTKSMIKRPVISSNCRTIYKTLTTTLHANASASLNPF
jgi:maleate cis-trans isomerase